MNTELKTGLIIFGMAMVTIMSIAVLRSVFWFDRFLPPAAISSAELTGTYETGCEIAVCNGRQIPVLPEPIVEVATVSSFGSGQPSFFNTDQEKRIEVHLAKQRVYAFEGDTKVFDFLVSTGDVRPDSSGGIWDLGETAPHPDERWFRRAGNGVRPAECPVRDVFLQCRLLP